MQKTTVCILKYITCQIQTFRSIQLGLFVDGHGALNFLCLDTMANCCSDINAVCTHFVWQILNTDFLASSFVVFFFCICLITICLNHTEVDCKGVLKQDIEIKLGQLRSPGTLQWSHVTEPESHGYCCMLCFKSFSRSLKKSKIYVLGSIRRPSSVKCGN